MKKRELRLPHRHNPRYSGDPAGGKDYLKVAEKVGNWDEFRNKFLEVRKKYA